MKQALNFGWRFIPDYKQSYLGKMNEGVLVNIPHILKEENDEKLKGIALISSLILLK